MELFHFLSTGPLALTCRNWSAISKDAYAKTEWLLVRYGKSHALFHAVRLGPTFMDIPSIELKIEHNVGQLDADRIRAFQQNIKSPWASNLPIFMFTYLLDKGYKQLANMNETLPSKGFSLKDNVIIDALHMFEHRLNEIGDILWDIFLAIRSGENVYSLAFKFFREAFKNPKEI
ncbi:hypothetical protein RhiirB3_522092 [Rhizophagus irregularis]|nr:hypothetical protein RhiirB3_522092 [Rhizophagus irregularis]